MSQTETNPSSPFASEFPELLQKIEANWPILPSGIWNSSSIQKLSRHLHELSLRSERAGEAELMRVIAEIDETVTRIIDDNTPPDDARLERLNQLLAQLRALISGLPVTTPPAQPTTRTVTPTDPLDLIYLLPPEGDDAPFDHALAARGLRHLRVDDPQALQFALVEPGAKSLLIDASYLGSQPIEPVLHLLKSFRATAPALFVLSDQSDIETRLNALRAGALQLFSRPVEAERLIDALLAQIDPQPRPRDRILIVEDDEAQASFAAKLLQKGGMDTLAINDPLQVIDAVTRFQPDLILMDLYMPGADGIELTRVIRDRWDSSAIPVLFVSGEGDLDKKLLALQAGADDFLTKPVRPQQLLATVRTRIERARQIAEVAAKQAGENDRRPAGRRALLTRLDLALAEAGDPSGFRALLVICLDHAAAAEAQADPSTAAAAILPLLQDEDLLAVLDGHRLALLYRRNDEKVLEDLAERIYATLAGGQAEGRQAPLGIGMVLLNGVERNAYAQLVHAEHSALSACRRRVRGFELYGETPLESEESRDAATARREGLLKSMREGTLAFRQLHYNSRKAGGPETVELIPLPTPSGGGEDPYLSAEAAGLSLEFDRHVCRQALKSHGERVAKGLTGRLIFRQSAAVAADADYVEFIKSELRRRQIVGTGLMVEFDLPALAANLKTARPLIGELAGMGIAVILANFSCNETAYKVLAYLRADAVRPHRALLRIDAARIQHIAQQLQSLHAEIFLPRVASHGQIALPWTEFADCIQAEFAG